MILLETIYPFSIAEYPSSIIPLEVAHIYLRIVGTLRFFDKSLKPTLLFVRLLRSGFMLMEKQVPEHWENLSGVWCRKSTGELVLVQWFFGGFSKPWAFGLLLRINMKTPQIQSWLKVSSEFLQNNLKYHNCPQNMLIFNETDERAPNFKMDVFSD